MSKRTRKPTTANKSTRTERSKANGIFGFGYWGGNRLFDGTLGCKKCLTNRYWYAIIKILKERVIKMLYKEITSYDIQHNPQKIQEIITDNVHRLQNDLYILNDGNHFVFDTDAKNALFNLMLKIKYILEKPIDK